MSEGYFVAPNKMVPLQDREPGEIAAIALEQLRPYQEFAAEFGVYPDGRCRRCMECDENIYFTTDPNGVPYTYTDDELSGLKVAHIRQCHSKEVEEWMKTRPNSGQSSSV